MDGLSPGLAAIVGRAMSLDPADRYPDAGAFRDALLAADGTVDAEARTAVVPIVPIVPSEPAVTAAPAVAAAPAVPAVLPLAGPGHGAAEPARATGPWRSPVERSASIFIGTVAALALALVVALGVMGSAGSAAARPSAGPAEPGRVRPAAYGRGGGDADVR